MCRYSEKMQELMVVCIVLFRIILWLNSIYDATHVIVFELCFIMGHVLSTVTLTEDLSFAPCGIFVRVFYDRHAFRRPRKFIHI